MQCRHEAVFNIGRPKPILDVHARVCTLVLHGVSGDVISS
jgi:hypothetical protein